jgi:AraC-like DNA-binding protein
MNSQVLAPQLQDLPGDRHDHFNVSAVPAHHQWLAWRQYVGSFIDVLPMEGQLGSPFSARIDRYRLGNRLFTDCASDALLLDRSVGRIATDTMRDYAFHIFIQGGVQVLEGEAPQPREFTQASILAMDTNQPIRLLCSQCRVLSFYVPRIVVNASLPNAESIHGRVIENNTPLTQLLMAHVVALSSSLMSLSADEAAVTFDTGVQLMLGAFARQAKLGGSVRAATRSAMFDQARRYVQNNLYQPWLSPESLLLDLQLPRHTLYRLFEHEGGLGAYIRRSRLREAADDLVRYPHRQVVEIAYSLGFKSASDFSRAFHRQYGMTAQQHRLLAAQRMGERFLGAGVVFSD